MDQEARELRRDEQESLLAIMLDRHEELVKAYWELAVSGSLKDAEFVLKTLQSEIRLAQLDVPDARQVGQTVLVVSGDSEAEYVRSLGGQLPDNKSQED